MSDERERETGFTVRDRRTFAADGDETKAKRPAPDEAPQADAGPSTGDLRQAARAVSDAAQAPGAGQALPAIDFATFLMSLGTSAMFHLGVIPDPESKEPKVDLPLAKQTIDILGMLQEKSEGNRTADETNLLHNLLYDLRIRFVEASKK